jgi:leucyl/phenylalanyl-tRNA--protein transferase
MNFDIVYDFPPPELFNRIDPFIGSDLSQPISVGGNYNPYTLINAYSKGIFPWYEIDGKPYWFSPNPRFVIMKEDFNIPRSTKKLIKQNKFRITLDKDFRSVMEHCKMTRINSWITNNMIEGYTMLFEAGYAHSVEVWLDDKIVGGLYGVCIGKYFSGESMFFLVSGASKVAFSVFGKLLFDKANFKFIDCQVYTNLFRMFGGREIPRENFLKLLFEEKKKETNIFQEYRGKEINYEILFS